MFVHKSINEQTKPNMVIDDDDDGQWLQTHASIKYIYVWNYLRLETKTIIYPINYLTGDHYYYHQQQQQHFQIKWLWKKKIHSIDTNEKKSR